MIQTRRTWYDKIGLREKKLRLNQDRQPADPFCDLRMCRGEKASQAKFSNRQLQGAVPGRLVMSGSCR
jgi:hypothetical protein